ncbi:hypothetical protein ABZ468_51655 [Streptomyces sp. NPDC005708]|uniref:hypothetical protein n=1 Tax=unclassified Streptomyces TaxID=2593676 RepID=UPI0033CC1605
MAAFTAGQSKLYPATAIDLSSRRMPVCAMGAHDHADLVVPAPWMAAAVRGGDVRRGIPEAREAREARHERTGHR